MSRLGRRHPVKPTINRLIAFAEPVSPLWTQYVVSRVSVSESALRYAIKSRQTQINYPGTLEPPPPPPIGDITEITRESVRRAYHRSADIYTPFIQTIRPPDPIKIPCLVPTDPNAPTRTREHLDLVSVILNSLIMQRELIREAGQTARGDWKLGYVPETYQNWPDPPPKTIREALDMIAARLQALENP
jgi:hypothetical protein